jgi:uncharacterized circularly permuted ATP-grasp superfamily protein/uncharacterized alpha-E superfamily protein
MESGQMPMSIERHTAVVCPLFEEYAPSAGVFDECAVSRGQLREPFLRFSQSLPNLTAAELKRRGEIARRIIHEQGITYNIYGEGPNRERPWQLDPLPLVIGAAEWQSLETALIQRATLLNRILADCYGSQELIRSGWLPPALVYAQPDFLRPCHGLQPSGGVFLHLYSADLARSADGHWWVTADRTQIPTGAGYALANRLIAARILGEPFRHCHVQRLARFFRELQTTLTRLGSRRTDSARIVLLTPGPFNETFFEQVWLARYLGYALVEGQDLTVRDDRVFLKTLSGLEPVDVILRRVDDEWCDPLELRSDSMLGVPGLIRALRAGNVAVANAMGTGLLQSPAFMPFLAGLCRHLLSEELKLPSIPTWWCGQHEARSHVLEHLQTLEVRPAFRPHPEAVLFDPTISAQGRRATPPPPSPVGNNVEEASALDDLALLRRQVEFQAELFVAQERLSLSTAPALDGVGIVPRPISLRVYLVATAEGYRAMPGGLTRVGGEPHPGGVVTPQQGSASKDTWVLSNEPVDDVTLLGTSPQTIELRRVGNNLPSRLADNFFWLGRYAERADATSRLLRSLLVRFSPESSSGTFALIEPMLNTLIQQGQIVPLGSRPDHNPRPETTEAELLKTIYEPKRRGSLREIALELQRLAILVRDRTSNDLWRVLAELGELLTRSNDNAPPTIGDAIGVLNQTLLHLSALHGLARENMTRAQGWRFLDIGLRLERIIYLSTFFDYALRSSEADNASILETVLEVADSTLTYRSRYNLLPNIAAVYDLVMLDDTNPRSLLFQFNQLVKHFERLPRERESALPSSAQRILFAGLTRLRLVDPRSLLRRNGKWHHSDVGTVITRILRDLPKLSDAIAVSYFAHSTISRSL